jgi:hypothetical protein
LDLPVTRLIDLFANRQHIFQRHPRGQQALMAVSQDEFRYFHEP